MTQVKRTNEEKTALHNKIIVVDTHNDTMSRVINTETWLPEFDLGEDTTFHIDMNKAKKGGLDVAFYAAFTVYKGEGDERFPKTNSRVLAMLNALYHTERQNPKTFKIAKSVSEIKEAVKKGLHAAVPAMEGGYALEEDNAMELLEQYYDLGVRYLTLVWNFENELGYGTATVEEKGLKDLGRRVIDKMEELGMMVDVSHMNEKTFWDTAAHAKGPLLASHSSCSALIPHVRNLTDDQIKAVAKSGGTINVNYWDELLANPKNTATISHLVDHIDHIVNLVGVDYAGLGSDFDGTDIPIDLKDSSELPKITAELVNRGYSDEDIEKILGGNTLRVFGDVESRRTNLTKTIPGISIVSGVRMGDLLNDSKPTFTAGVTGLKAGGGYKLKVILDGKAFDGILDQAEGEISFKPSFDLFKGVFHVLTFELSNGLNEKTRETIIFYLENSEV
ncbi:MAG: dipeptidase [Clostridiaceae bacterium]